MTAPDPLFPPLLPPRSVPNTAQVPPSQPTPGPLLQSPAQYSHYPVRQPVQARAEQHASSPARPRYNSPSLSRPAQLSGPSSSRGISKPSSLSKPRTTQGMIEQLSRQGDLSRRQTSAPWEERSAPPFHEVSGISRADDQSMLHNPVPRARERQEQGKPSRQSGSYSQRNVYGRR